MKPISLLIATLAIPAGIASAQTPSTTTSTGQPPYIPLIPSNSGGTGTTTTSSTVTPVSTWYIDTTRNLIVMCTQTVSTTSGGSTATQSFTCTAQAVPTAATSGTSGGTTGSGTTGSGTSGSSGSSSGGAGSNPMGG